MKHGFTQHQNFSKGRSAIRVLRGSSWRCFGAGFTLVETVVIIALTLIALAALVNLFVIFSSLNGYQQAVIATDGSASISMNAFEAAILPASNVLVSHNFSGTTYTTSADTLVLQLPAVNSSGTIIAGVSDYIVFYRSSNTLYQLTEIGGESVRRPGRVSLSTTLSTLSFTYNNADVTQATAVTVDIQTLEQYQTQTAQSRLREQLYLRNFSPL